MMPVQGLFYQKENWCCISAFRSEISGSKDVMLVQWYTYYDLSEILVTVVIFLKSCWSYDIPIMISSLAN